MFIRGNRPNEYRLNNDYKLSILCELILSKKSNKDQIEIVKFFKKGNKNLEQVMKIKKHLKKGIYIETDLNTKNNSKKKETFYWCKLRKHNGSGST